MNYESLSLEGTEKIAVDLASKLITSIKKNNRTIVIGLIGDLGVGKTTFVQYFAKALGIKDKIISPTFMLIRQYLIPKSKFILYHSDLYRLGENIDIKQIGLNEIIESPNNIILIEWAEKMMHKLPGNTVLINLTKVSKNKRSIKISRVEKS